MADEVSDFLRQHPDPEFLDVLICDPNGIVRGKKVARSQVAKTLAEGILLPRSIFGTDVCGDTVDKTNLGMTSGDQDFWCRPQPGTLVPTPWANGAQCLVEMVDGKERPFAISPREVLRRVVQRLHEGGVYPTVAVELEFYLFLPELVDGRPQFLLDPLTGGPQRSTQVYSMSDLQAQEPFIVSVREYCAAQGVEASAALAEYAPGQFEINLQHLPDPVRACDQAVYLKRIIRIAAGEHNMLATFMAKPVTGITGSGMHIHVSLCDRGEQNIFAEQPRHLGHAIGGLQAHMPDSMLLFAPHANSYRRFRPGFFVPVQATWGHNNRTVAIRVPLSEEKARRIEHRVAGADANVYLVVAAVLAAMATGLEQRLAPTDPVEGNAAELDGPTLPLDWMQAIERFAGSDWARASFGAQFVDLYTLIKREEYGNYQQYVTARDIEWYLQTL